MECALSQNDDRLVRVLNCDDFVPLVCDIVETCSVLVKIYPICFENTVVVFTCIFSIAITVVNNFNFTRYKIMIDWFAC
jgi:hypothetical protein